MAGISLNGAYNHFIQDYVSKDVAHADNHRKDELRDVYKSIAKLNKNSPLYLLTDDDKSRNDAIDIKERARQLQGNIIGLNNQEDRSSLDHSTAYTTNEDKVVASYIGKNPEADIDSAYFDISVDSLAAAQINTGKYLPKIFPGLSADNYAFDVRINNQEFEFQFSIYQSDKNVDVQERIATLINKAGIGISASVLDDGEGSTALQISSTHTGLKSGDTKQFEIYESSSGLATGSVTFLGLDQMTTPASNARFSLNGEEKTAISNKFTVGGKFELQLKAPSAPGESITVGVRKDNDALKNHITSLISSYNDFVNDATEEKGEKFKGDKLKTEIIGIAKQYMSDIEDTGIKLEANGTLSIDEELLNQAISGAESELSLAPVKQFSDALINKTKDISINPMKYVDRPIVNYKNPDNHDSSSPYITSEYSGMMFNNYC